MEESKLFRYLLRLNPKEWRGFKKYLASIYRAESDPVELFTYLFQYRKDLAHRNLSIEKIIDRLFPHLSEKSFRNIMSVLVSEIEEFWIIQDLRNNKKEWALQRMLSLNRRHLYSEASKAFVKLERETHSETSIDLLNDQYLLRARHDLYFSDHPRDSKVSLNLLETLVNLSIRSTAHLVNFYETEIINVSQRTNVNIDAILNLVKNQVALGEDTELSRILNLQKNVQISRSPEMILKLKMLVFSVDLKLERLLKLVLYERIRQALRWQVRNGDHSKLKLLIDLIESSYAEKVVVLNDVVSESTFLGDIRTLCAVDAINNAEVIYKKFRGMLSPVVKEEVLLEAELTIKFVKKEYDEVILAYVTYSFLKAPQKLNSLGLFLRASYEIYGKDVAYFENYLRNAKDFLIRNASRLSMDQLSSWRNFLRGFKMLINKYENQKLKIMLQKQELIIHRRWLLEKLEEQS